MTAKDPPNGRFRPVFIAFLLLATGAGSGLALAELTPTQPDARIWTAGAAVAALAVAALIAIMLRRGQRSEGESRTGDVALTAADRNVSSAPGDDSASDEQAAAPSPTRHIVALETPAPVDGPVIDENTLESLHKLGGEEFVSEIVTQFTSEGVLALFKVAQAIGQGDAAEYGAQVHALRSSAANVGAKRLYKLCLEWREISTEELAISGSARFIQLQKEFSAAERNLKERQSHARDMVAATAKAG